MAHVSLSRLACAAAFAVSSLGAQAATHLLGLSGVLAEASTFSNDIAGTHYEDWSVQLHGLDAGNAFTLAQDDTVTALITFDQALTVPVSQTLTFYTFLLQGTGFTGDLVATAGSSDFKLGGTTVFSSPSNCQTSSQVADCFALFPPNNAALTFDEVALQFTVGTLSAPVLVDSARYGYTLFSPSAVPEPASYAMLLAGFGLLGLRRARRG